MKKLLILLVCVGLLIGCSKNNDLDKNVSILPTGISFKFENYDKSSEFRTIFESTDGSKIISEFKEIFYEDYDNAVDEIKLEEALSKNIITIDSLIERMTLVDSTKDINLLQ